MPPKHLGGTLGCSLWALYVLANSVQSLSGAVGIFTESLILAQDERLRRA